MPLFDFECPTCGSREEDVLMRTTQFDQLPCPNQCPEGMRRLPAAPAIRFVGYGWTPKFSGRGRKDPNDTLEETEGGQLRDKTGAGHDSP